MIDGRIVDSDKPIEITFSFGIKTLNDGIPVCHYLLYRSESESSVLSFGSYTAGIKPDDIDMGIVICTFRREERVIRMLDRIMKVMSDDRYVMSNKITVYVIDNGRTLKDVPDHENIKLIPNNNNGGSGGFARGMIESRKDKKTHILLMDDDIEIDPNVISKTFNFVSILNERHKDAFILGGMLLPENPSIQYEAGAEQIPIFKRGKHGLDLSTREGLLINDKKEPAQYGGWWYICMPSAAADELPLPMFVKLDDVIFGIRRMKDHAVMNGIGVWHDSFESKANPITDYYFLKRNTLVFNSMYNPGNGFVYGREYLRRMIYCIKEGKIDEYHFSRLAMRDFLKGPDFFKENNTEEIFGSEHTDDFSRKDGTAVGRIIRNSSPRELLSLLSETLALTLNWNRLGKSYRDGIEYFTSYEFWESMR
jgi:GT2 family glycosyltransferase